MKDLQNYVIFQHSFSLSDELEKKFQKEHRDDYIIMACLYKYVVYTHISAVLMRRM